MKTVTLNKHEMVIDKSEYEILTKASLWEDALECAGVDNWSGYDTAIEIYQEMLIDSGLTK